MHCSSLVCGWLRGCFAACPCAPDSELGAAVGGHRAIARQCHENDPGTGSGSSCQHSHFNFWPRIIYSECPSVCNADSLSYAHAPTIPRYIASEIFPGRKQSYFSQDLRCDVKSGEDIHQTCLEEWVQIQLRKYHQNCNNPVNPQKDTYYSANPSHSLDNDHWCPCFLGLFMKCKKTLSSPIARRLQFSG